MLETGARKSQVPLILVIDDTPITGAILNRTLQKQGYQVLLANNGEQGREMVLQQQPDLILLDVMMPGEDGFDTIRLLKDDKKTAGIPVIFLTAVNNIDAKISAFNSGVVDYITKPFYAREVIARVRLHLKLSRATNALIQHQAKRLKEIEQAQRAFLVKPEQLPAANFAVHFQSFMEVGGDFYEVIEVSKDIFSFFVADVSGHNIKTSYITTALKALLAQNCNPIYTTTETMQIMNDVLINILSDEEYLSATYVRLNRSTLQVEVINAGHPPPLLVRADGTAEFLETGGDLLGIFSPVQFDLRKEIVSRGDRVFLFTDGLLERLNSGGVWTAELPRLLQMSQGLAEYSLEENIRNLTAKMLGEEIVPDDDVLLLGFEV
jgi:sigma-B regulation protein RsbU (phosphoserine phosphatase)